MPLYLEEQFAIVNTIGHRDRAAGPARLLFHDQGGGIRLHAGAGVTSSERGIRVNAVAPGPVWSPLQTRPTKPAERVAKLGRTSP